MAIHLQSSIHLSNYWGKRSTSAPALLRFDKRRSFLCPFPFRSPEPPHAYSPIVSSFLLLTACQCSRAKLNAFVRSLFSLTLIEFCEFYLPFTTPPPTPYPTVYAFSFIQCVLTVLHCCCCYNSILGAFLFAGPLAIRPTGSWCHFYMAEFIMDNNKNCRKLLPTMRRWAGGAYAKLGRQLLAYPAILQELRSPSPYGQWHEFSS